MEKKFKKNVRDPTILETLLAGFNRQMRKDPKMFYSLWYQLVLICAGEDDPDMLTQDYRLVASTLKQQRGILLHYPKGPERGIYTAAIDVEIPGQKEPLFFININYDQNRNRIWDLTIDQMFIDSPTHFDPFFFAVPPPPYRVFAITTYTYNTCMKGKYEEQLRIFLKPSR